MIQIAFSLKSNLLFRGGAAAAGNPNMTDATGLAYEGANEISTRLMPLDHVINRPEDVLNLLLDIAPTSFSNLNYFLGGNINIDDNSTSVHSAMRNSVWNVITLNRVDNDKVRAFVPNDVTGICYNHHSPLEPDWRNASWGDNYDVLNAIKDKYDPNHYFNCWHCVGYIGDEGTRTPTAAPTSLYTSTPTSPRLESSVPSSSSPSALPSSETTSTPTSPRLESSVPSSPSPSTLPSSEATTSSSCTDSTLRFKLFWRSRPIVRDCIWVANKATKQRCAVDGIAEICPDTCGTCAECADSTVRFKVTWNDRKISRDCTWVANRATVMRCNLPGVADGCRSTCQKC